MALSPASSEAGGNTTAQVVASGKVLPVAAPSGVTVDTTTYNNTITGSGKLTTLVFAAQSGVLAVAITGDAFPRWLMTADPTDGLYFGNGTFDPYASGAAIALQRIGTESKFLIEGTHSSLTTGTPDANRGYISTSSAPLAVVGDVALSSGTGVPGGGGAVGDLYFRQDGGGVLNTIYRCTVAGSAGAATWVGIV